ncbi:MAG: GH92 family glycosyl hydrolase [Archangium sp.]
MKKIVIAVSCGLIACAPTAPESLAPPAVEDPLVYASPAMGTGGFAYFHGSAFVGAAVPHGLIKAGPDTRGRYGTLNFIHYSGYWADDDTVMGFSQLHLHGTGATDWGVLSLMPVTTGEASVLSRAQYQSKFSKRSEVLSPGSYEVALTKWNDVKVELTASTHAAHHRYTFKEADTPHVVLDLREALQGGDLSEQTVTLINDTTLRGSMLSNGGFSRGFGGNRVFFELRTNRAYEVVQRAGDAALLLKFAAGAPVEVMLGVSLVSAEGATRNLEVEMPTFDFAEHKEAAETAWRERLSRMTVFGGSEEDRATFYSALRLAFLMPTVISDVDGAYSFGGTRASVPAGEVMLSDFSLWDTYRTVHPLYALVHEDIARDSVNSLTRMAANGRGFPRWPMATGEAGTMVGAPADIVIADAVLRGVPGVDATTVYPLLRAEALGKPTSGSRAGMGGYATRGWVPVEESGRSVGITVEYAHADFALANLARQLGELEDAQQFEARSKGWRQLFDADLGVLRPKKADGTKVTDAFTSGSWDHYAEANGWQTTFMPSWDIGGLDEVFGGREQFLTALTAFFDGAPGEHASAMADANYELRYLPRSYYWPSNEPDIQAPFMFAQAGRPELTAKWTDWARRTFFSAKPDGLPGNDDGGTLGSWFVLAAMGLYPVPGSDQWIIGTPLFPKLNVKLPGGGVFTIEARGVSAEAIYVQSATLNGVAVTRATLNHAELRGSLVLQMGTEPSKWAQ